jgi:pyridoxamine 5'-phosphate oxidase
MLAQDSTLTDLEARIWQELVSAAESRGHAWRTMVLATSDAQGQADARSVVLREAHLEQHELIFYTDARSPKVAQASVRPEAVLVMWSPELGWQLRLKARLRIETSGLAVSSRWAKLSMTPAAHDYLAPLPPGSALGPSTPERASRQHFAVVAAEIQVIDWLDLDRNGHRRARFGPGRQASWLQP